jgi:hypothetical protein
MLGRDLPADGLGTKDFKFNVGAVSCPWMDVTGSCSCKDKEATVKDVGCKPDRIYDEPVVKRQILLVVDKGSLSGVLPTFRPNHKPN